VYFLGAGASAAVSATAVVTSNLLQKALAASEPTDAAPESASEEPPHSVADARAIAREFVRFTARQDFVPSVDDVLALVDSAIARELDLSTDWPLHRLGEVRRALELLMFDCVERHVHGGAPRDGMWFKFISRCRAEQAAIVTLNWDCLVERTLAAIAGQQRGIVDYGLSCVTEDGSPLVPDSDAIVVLKPHGSLSWRHCTVCQALVVDPLHPMGKLRRPCPCCWTRRMRQVLVPPVVSDPSRPWYLAGLWKRVEDAIYASDKLTFIGYSLPSQDVHVRMHLVRAVARRRAKRGVPLRLEVVAKRAGGAGGTAASSLEESRYNGLLGGLFDPPNFLFRAFPDGMADWMRGDN
jgi:hypothetical protein